MTRRAETKKISEPTDEDAMALTGRERLGDW
jgi:hypothetical protein